ncbi:solute carrier organic anion transporter family member 74D-like [Adelges cooleyi]|uniref:solute carrier organic anion transporter family member 74D-like n=1 Tax=Adelges cooleyi TaxID=133065 RepID=UPI00217FD17A|nr:solute carrier organic anion transporter family member 74D-like [Adelges cooleyi]XP_050421877.1 solute carrier organic anion transporter family member 74D-like [Adelges cooleyi]
MSNPSDEDTSCGLWIFKPKWLQVFASKKAYVIMYGLLGFNQCILSSYFNGTLTTMEKRFKYSSQMSGIISSTWDLFSLMSFMVVSHIGGKGHRARWLAYGSMLVGISCFIRLVPHLIYGPGVEVLKYTKEYGEGVNSTSAIMNLASNNNKMCDANVFTEDCENKEFWNMAALILCAAHAVIGLGSSVYWTCGTAYLDDNVRKNSFPVLLAIVQCIRMMGPALGYALAAYTLTIFIEPTLTPTIDNDNPRWIGAWWMGWAPIGAICIVCASLTLLFPRSLPRAVARNKDQSTNGKKELLPTDFKTSMKRILSNKILVLNSASSSFFVMGLIGWWTFMPKYLETQFRQSASESNFVSGTVGVISSGAGIAVSGIIITKFKPSPRKLALWNVVVEFLEAIGFFMYAFIGCPADDIHGHWNADNTWNVTMSCNSDCNCSPSMDYNPICSYDKLTTFYSPCHAGCSQVDTINGTKWYGGCECIEGLGTAFEGLCPIDCGNNFIIFLFIMAGTRFLSSTGRAGNTIIQIRSVEEQDKSLALGFTEVLVAVVAFLPGPIFYGTIVDTTCIIWGSKCGSTGNCWLYDGKRFKYYLNFISTGFLIVGTALDVGVWYHVKGLKIYDDENDNTIEVNKNRISVEKRDSANDLKMKELGKMESKKAESKETAEKQ